MSEWTWDPDDFAALWLNDGRDRFPRPLHFTSRFRYREDFDAHARGVRARYTGEESSAIELALNTLAAATIRVEVFAETGPSGSHVHRIVGARDLHNAVIAAQTVIDGVDGPIWVRRGRPENLGKGIASRIPPCAPGRRRAEEFFTRDLEPDYNNHFTDVAHNTPIERYNRVVAHPRSGSGSAAIRTGDINTRTDPERYIEWLDMADDGRYIVHRTRERLTIESGDTAALATIVTGWIDRALERQREAVNR
ncbi:hypothetical protein NN3_07540 [Nocardia neocaledoniensis NBRC 108232]|uniref:ESAT-6 protein secretion system EspG family protein n=1 Tax=Nocardia neocaledoniensis TaxID=236511 RepID=A0A317NF87_9NOCA|nr:ESX secretion-associated protein EspG [Nocardia neocaledoniensis]PWV73762.1 ESAT-6 protein secretion system EspG family protein [Nocardia neocaledoniensis]GEM29747.1 hypothetical protein NN3_07540 [Nocardia neocaledoniensis NBRC 108232]